MNSPKDVNEAIQDAVVFLNVPRPDLGVLCSTRGAYAGKLRVLEAPGHRWIDASRVTSAGLSIPGDCTTIQNFQFDSKARYNLSLLVGPRGVPFSGTQSRLQRNPGTRLTVCIVLFVTKY